MCIIDCITDSLKQPQARIDIELVLIAIVRDRQAIDIFHGKKRRALFRQSAIQQPCDIGVLQSGQNLAFALKAPDDFVGIHAALDQLERDLLLEIAFGALGEKDRAHAADADLLHQFVGTDLRAGFVGIFEHIDGLHGAAIEQTVAFAVGIQQRLHFLQQAGIIAAALFQKGFAFASGQRQRGIEKLLDFLPV